MSSVNFTNNFGILLLLLSQLCRVISLNIPAGSTRISYSQKFLKTSRADVYSGVVNFLFREGAGFGPPVRLLVDGDSQSGEGLLREIPPLGLKEKITKAELANFLTYNIENPSPFTFPVEWHQGQFSFSDNDEGSSDLSWDIYFVPMKLPFASLIVTKISEAIVQVYLSNLAKYLGEDSVQPFKNNAEP